MNIFFSKFVLITILLSCTSQLISQQKTYFLKGKIIDRPQTTAVLLTKKGGDARVLNTEIPVLENNFEYKLLSYEGEGFELFFKDEANWIYSSVFDFLAEEDTISIELHPRNQRYKNNIIAGKLNNSKIRLEQIIDSIFDDTDLSKRSYLLEKNNDVYNPILKEYELLLEKADADKKDSISYIIDKMYEIGDIYSENYKALNYEYEQLDRKKITWILNYVNDNVDLVSFDKLLEIVRTDFDKKYIDHSYEIFQNKYNLIYPDHPYTEEFKKLYQSYAQVRAGNRFIDFECPTFDGDNKKLSELIQGKIALLDLWASWCGPCRSRSIAVIPIFEKYKDKGFTVVGVAREQKAENAINAANKDKYPWINLLELNDKNKIWNKYGIGNSGGATFLIDKDGTIIAIKPTVKEIERILDERL